MPDESRLRSNLWKIAAIRTLFWMHFFTAVLVPFFTIGGHLSLSQVMFLNSWFMFWNFILEVPTGTVADFFGRKISLALGCLTAALATLVYVSHLDMVTFMVAEVMFAAAFTLMSGADEALAYDSLKAMNLEKDAPVRLARLESFKLGGIVIGSLCGGFIANRYGLTGPFLAYFAPAVLGFVLSLTLYEVPASHHESRPLKELGYLALLKEGLAYFKGHRVLMLLTAEICVTNALAWALIWLYQPLLEKAGMDIKFFGVIHAMACGAQILFLNNVERFEDWFGGKRLVLVFCSVMTGLLFVLLGFLNSKFLLAGTVVLAFMFSLPRVVLFSAYMNKYIPSDKRATVLSASSMLRTLAIVISNLVIGPLADWNLQQTMTILGATIIVLAAFSKIEEQHLS